MAKGQFAEGEIARAYADKAERRMADGGGHATNLTVFPFDQFEREPRVGDALTDADGRSPQVDGRGGLQHAGATRERAVSVDGDAAAGEVSECSRGGLAFDLCPVFAAMGVLGVEEAVVQPRFIAEEKQALGVGIEAAERIDSTGQTEFGEGPPTRSRLGGELREDAVRFVEGEQHVGQVGSEGGDSDGTGQRDRFGRVRIPPWLRQPNSGNVGVFLWATIQNSLRVSWPVAAASGSGR